VSSAAAGVKKRKVSVYSSKSSMAILKNMNKLLVLNSSVSSMTKDIDKEESIEV
jgi:hypothetical protein